MVIPPGIFHGEIPGIPPGILPILPGIPPGMPHILPGMLHGERVGMPPGILPMLHGLRPDILLAFDMGFVIEFIDQFPLP